MPKRSAKGRLFFWTNALLVVVVAAYKIYLNFFEQDFAAVHAQQVERIEQTLGERTEYQFAVLGNINNSVGIFERKIIPMLNRSGIDFVISAGNAVSSGGEDKYRALYRTLGWLHIPYLLSFGDGEESRLGSFRFYDHFGPYLFSFSAGNSRFIFLDSTGKTDFQWQLRWLEEELVSNTDEHTFVFSAHPLRAVVEPRPWDSGDNYLIDERARAPLAKIIEQHGVDAVFSANLPLYSEQRHGATRYVLTGGAGGFVPDSEHSYYHYVQVAIDGDQVLIEPVRLDIAQHAFWRTLESLWFFIHSLFYVGYLNFILLVSALVVVIMRVHSLVFVDRDYYPDFDIDPTPYLRKPLRIAMFTNNFLPFIGGVPIAIERLRCGLRELGHRVLVVAPCYRKSAHDESDVLRVGSLLPLGKLSEFRLANIFSWKLYHQSFRFRPHLIHVHHPFWLGSAGVLLARLLKVPAVYTYHTRLEHYAHYVLLPGPLFRNLVSHAMVKCFANRCDAIIVPTDASEDYLRMIGVKKPIFVQPTGIDFQRFRDVTNNDIEQLRTQLDLGDELVLISTSRLSKEKNIDFIIDAVAELSKRSKTPFRLLLIGDGEEREHLQQRLNSEQLNGYVTLVGAVEPELVPLYCRLGDVFVFASRSETQGMVILEAMAAGLPVVAVRSSGIDDFVQNGINGYKTALDRNRWSAKVEELMADSELRKRLADNAVAFAATYGVPQVSRKMVEIYAQVLAEHAAATLTNRPKAVAAVDTAVEDARH